MAVIVRAFGLGGKVFREYYADTEAELPTTGLSAGDYGYAIDTKKVFLASSATTWQETPQAVSGVLPTANLGTGSPTGSKYLRDDGMWQVPPGGGGPHATTHQPGGDDVMAVDAAVGTGSLRTIGTGAAQACAGNDARLIDARAPTAHTHPASDLASGTVAPARLGSGSGGATKFLREDSTWQTVSGGDGGAKATYISLVRHFTTLEDTTSANATWKIPAATTYGQIAVRLDMTKLGTPASAELVVVYTNTATTGTNQIGIRLGAAPVAAGTTVTAIASSVATLANSSTYPQTIVKAITVAELGSTAQWLQLALILATSTVGPNIFSADLILYY